MTGLVVPGTVSNATELRPFRGTVYDTENEPVSRPLREP